MTMIEVYGWLCALAGMLAILPQVQRLVTTRTSAGLSLLMFQLTTGGVLGWVVHGLNYGALNVIVPNAFTALMNLAVLALMQRDRGLSPLRVWPLVGAIFAVVATVDLTLPGGFFGLFVLVPLSVGLIAQLRDLLKATDLSGLSFPFIAANCGIQFLWFVWGALAGDLSVVLCAGILAIVTTLILGVYLVRNSRLARASASDPASAELGGTVVEWKVPATAA